MNNTWATYKLGEICNFQGGSQPPKSEFSIVKKEGYIRLIQIRDYKSDNFIIFIPEKRAKRFCNEEEIMIGRYGPPVFQILKGIKGAYNVALMKAIPNEKIISKDYLYIFLKYSEIQDYIIRLSQRAAGQSGVNKRALESYPIQIPSLIEQQRIVKIFINTFESISQVKNNTEKNLHNIHELNKSYLNKIFSNPAKDETSCELNDYVKFIDYRGRTPKKTTSGLRLITAKNIKMGFLQRDPEEFINPDDYEKWMTRGIPKKGDVLFTTEAPLANVAQLDTDEKVAFAQRTIIFQPEANKLDQSYLKYLLLAPPIQKIIQDKGTGATVKGIKASVLKKIHIQFPNLMTQKSLVTKLDELSIEIKKLEQKYNKKLKDIEELKKSILQKLFAGELRYI
ncbi:restriction endonuclease subunit S [Candidatus Gottesmanbacteria bacterium]|nr:restriction endonuclease subunit S [Candidatus Gottesmanbacteria bacterium]